MFFIKSLNAGQVYPLIGIRLHPLIYKQTASVACRSNLKGQCDQIAEAAPGHGILIGKHAVIGMKRKPCMLFHCQRQDGGAELARF